MLEKFNKGYLLSLLSSNAQYLLDNAPTARDAARLRSTTAKSAGAWLNVIPTSEVFALNSCKFCLASFLRFGLPIAFSSWTTTCNCGALIDDSGYHLLTCKTGGGPVWSHESISSVWSDCFRGLHIHHCRKPRSCYTTTDNRLDIVFFDSNIENNIDLDISLAHPWSSDIFPSSAGVSGAAAERRADRKKEKYSKQQLPGGIIATVTPGNGAFWSLGIDEWKLLCKLSKKSSDKVGRPNAAEFIDFWSKRFSVQLQKCNTRVISKKLSSLSEGNR